MGKSRLIPALAGGIIVLFAGNAAIPGSSKATTDAASHAAGDAIQGIEGVVQDASAGAGPMLQSVMGAVQQSGVGNVLGGQPTATTQPGAVPPAQQPSADGR